MVESCCYKILCLALIYCKSNTLRFLRELRERDCDFVTTSANDVDIISIRQRHDTLMKNCVTTP